jgi:hypothetical protein
LQSKSALAFEEICFRVFIAFYLILTELLEDNMPLNLDHDFFDRIWAWIAVCMVTKNSHK